MIGLGIMGTAMSANLLNSGHRVIGYDITLAARTRLADLGGRAVDTPAEVAAEAGVVITSLPSD